MSKDDAGYFGILPAEVRYDKNLRAEMKLLYVEITSLCRTAGHCWATNAYFAELFNTTERTIKRWVKTLCDKEYCYSVIKTFRWEDGTIKKVRYICLTKKAAEKVKSMSQEDIWRSHHSDISCQNHSDTDVPYNKINNELDNNLDTKVSKEQSSENLPLKVDKRNPDIEEAFSIWKEVMGYPLHQTTRERYSVSSILRRKEMDLEKLRILIRLVEASQHDKYKRFSISSFTDLMYKTNDLMAWAREKQAQQHTNVAEV